jgi:hypothetical protein
MSAEAMAPGEYWFVGLPVGPSTLEIRAPQFAPVQRKIDVVDGKSLRERIALERGVTLKGRALHPEGKPFRRPICEVAGAGKEIPLSPDGAFEIDGLAPGAKIGLVVLERGDGGGMFMTSRQDRVVIPTDRAELSADVPLVPAGRVVISVESERLFGDKPAMKEKRALARQSRLEIRDAEGRVAVEIEDVYPNWEEYLPLGQYTIRLEVPGASPKEQKLALTGPDGVSVTLVVE